MPKLKIATSPDLVRSAFATMVGVFLIGNVVGTMGVIGVLDSRPGDWALVMLGVGAGLILGEVTLLAIWGVLSAEPLVIRLPRALALAVLIFYSWQLGILLSTEEIPVDVSLVLSGLAMLLFLVLTTPLWIARNYLRCHISAVGRTSSAREQFTLRHILLWTAIVAGLTVLGRAIFAGYADSGGLPRAQEFVQIVAVVSVISLFVALLGLPLCWCVLMPTPSRRARQLSLLILLLGPPIVPETFYWIIGEFPDGDDRAIAVMAWYGFGLAAATITVGGLLIARRLGFQLLPMTGMPVNAKQLKP